VIETKGLSRISAYVGRVPIPATWAEATDFARTMNAKAFPAIRDNEWEDIARQLFNERNGKPTAGYDPELSRSMSVLDGPIPALWPQFEALKRAPMLVIRGERSDILSVETVEAMRSRHPRFSAITIAGEGHAPWLRDPVSIGAIRQFLDASEEKAATREYVYA
jgi:pimeloyl-ACP methyl ester carboxylesterase